MTIILCKLLTDEPNPTRERMLKRIFLLSGLAFLSVCSKTPQPKPAVFIFKHPVTLVKNIRSDYVIIPRFDNNATEVIFNGRLPGDAYDVIYTVPIKGGAPVKIYATNESVFSPAFSSDKQKVVFTLGDTRQICVLDLTTRSVVRLPIFGSTPLFLPDDNTVVFSSLIDGNIYLYHIPTKRTRALTNSFITGNYCPLIHPDRSRIIWLENLRQPIQRFNQTTLDSNRTTLMRQIPKALTYISLSPSGNWLIGSRANGEPLAFSLIDSAQAVVRIESDSANSGVKLLAQSVSWSPHGDAVVYIGNQTDFFSPQNPYIRHGKYIGDIVVANLEWKDLDNALLLQTPPVKNVNWFPLQTVAFAAPSSRFSPQVINNPPQIISTPPESIYEGDLYLYHLESVDIDLQDNLNYTLIRGPDNAEMLPHSGILLWLPPDTGSFNFIVRVQDSRYAEDFQNFTVRVLPKPQWHLASYLPPQKKPRPNDFSAGMLFLDSNDDGFLTPGETAAIKIDLKLLNQSLADSVKLEMLVSATTSEIAIEREIVFRNCQVGRWNRQIVEIKGLPALRNRPIIIRGILQTAQGIRLLPATLVINGKNPDEDKLEPGYDAVGTF